jgi:hypothetical protein
MTRMQATFLRNIILDVLAEQQRGRRDDSEARVLKAVATKLTLLGLNEDDHSELRADLQHLRWWRRNVEQAQSYLLKAIVTIFVTGFVGALWLAIKVTLGQ